MRRSRSGFTLVELLIVIVVIAILAAITIVAYGGVTQKATISALQSNLAQDASFLASYNATNGAYPADLATATSAGLKSNNNTTLIYQYSYDGPGNNDYCLAGISGSAIYGITDTNTAPQLNAGCGTLSGIVGWWTFDGTLNDSSGNNQTGTNDGAVPAAGQNGQANGAYSFSTSAILLPSPTALNTISSSDISVSAWVYLTSAPTNTWNDIIAGNNGDWGVGIDDGSGSPHLQMTDVGQYDAPISTTIVSVGMWHHVLVTYSTTTHLVSYYLDGAPDGSNTWSNIATNQSFTISPAGKTIGSRQYGSVTSTVYFHGSLDDIRVYNRVLSAQEARALYAAGAQ